METRVRAIWSRSSLDYGMERTFPAKPHEAVRQMLKSLEDDPHYDEEDSTLHKLEVLMEL